MLTFTIAFVLLFGLANTKVYFHEKVDNEFNNRWIKSANTKVTKNGELKVVSAESEGSEGKLFIETSEDSSHYQYGIKFDGSLDTSQKDLYFSYVAQHPQGLDCGGGYVKLMDAGVNFLDLHGETPYYFMFGPDHCGYSTKKVHFIVSHDGKNHELKESISNELDKKPHLYTLIVQKNGSFVVKVDQVVKKSGLITENFEILPPKQIDDPSDKKPEDWVDEAYIKDPNSKKPDNWVDEKTIVDPEAKKPEDWIDETDGEWVPDVIPNPEYKGEWEPESIKNPDYKGPWSPKKIDNPDYKEDDSIGKCSVGSIAIEIWQVKSGTRFAEFYVTDDLEEGEKHAEQMMKEIKSINQVLEKKEAEEAKKFEEEQKKDDSSKDNVDEEVDSDVDEDEIEDEDNQQEEVSHEDL